MVQCKIKSFDEFKSIIIVLLDFQLNVQCIMRVMRVLKMLIFAFVATTIRIMDVQ